MKVAIRVDASKLIGTGHAMRCVALAEGLRKFGAKILFIVRQSDSNFLHSLKELGFRYKALDAIEVPYTPSRNCELDLPSCSHWLTVDWRQDAIETQSILRNKNYDLLIIDHYALDYLWESMLRPHVKNILVIDDLADRQHNCDAILDSTCGRNKADYIELSSVNCRFLLGTKYALLRSEFLESRTTSLQRRLENNTVGRILVSMGGVDKDNLTETVLELLVKVNLPVNCEVNVVVGSEYSHVKKLRNRFGSFPRKLTIDAGVDDMACKIAEADIGIGSFGVSTWERCCLGLPSINIVVGEHNIRFAKALQKEKIGKVIFVNSMKSELIPAIQFAIENSEFRHQLSTRSSNLVDGKGVPRTVDWIASNL